MTVKDSFHSFARKSSDVMGTPYAFAIAIVILVVWAVSGPLFGFSDTWQLVINTATTIITFLMVFLIQNTQNRDARAIHLKLDELLKTQKGARNVFVDLENMTDDELNRLQKGFERVQKKKSGDGGAPKEKNGGAPKEKNGAATKEKNGGARKEKDGGD